MFERITSEFQCLEGLGQNSNVWKDKDRIQMCGRIGQEFQFLGKDEKRIPMFGRINKELQCLEG